MKSRGVVGKRIAKIVQERFYNHALGCMCNNVRHIELEDGTRLVPYTITTEDFDLGCSDAHDFVIGKPEKKGK